MNTEQAYINGFVKRAAEYGFNENEATQLAKEAMRGANAVSLALGGIGGKHKRLADHAVRAGLAGTPERGTLDAQILAKFLRQMKARERTFPVPKSYYSANSEADKLLNL